MRTAVAAGTLAAAACMPLAAGDGAQGRLAAGERAYQRCYACHALSAEETGAEGPHLRGIVGRKVASLPGYDYSPALRAYGGANRVWTRERLDRFLADPQSAAPGNAMGFFGMGDPAERAALIDWLALQRP